MVPGRLRLANVSAKTGNTLLGASQSWTEGVNGSEMLVNENLAAGFTSPWTFQVVAPAGGTRTLVTNGAPDGSTVFPQYMYVDYVRVYQWSNAATPPP